LLIDGNNIRRHNAASIRAAIGVVGPDLPLMRGTIGRNIRYRSPKASEAEVRRITDAPGMMYDRPEPAVSRRQLCRGAASRKRT
jgi:ABC-type multidrug transport system fused ATPase/permease subunit